MSIINDLRGMLADTVTWRPLASRDEYGAPAYGSSASFRARVVRKHKLVRDAQGDMVVSTGQAWLAGSPAVAPDDKITLSDGTSPPILTIERFQDELGPSHTVVFFR